ncbi:Uncharacterized protein HZ326_31605 [Fusarium oxysporum f. sp. albedinis]|nr:Uncharacterized protein HZ326_31605 [Fusarium oxysporum f. sp. albedinis]
MPCTYCFRGNKRCIISADSGRYNKYIRSKKSCDSMQQEKKLENNKDKASKDLLRLHKEMAALQSRLAAAAGRLLHIYKIKSRVREKHSKATHRGLQEVEQ